MIRSLLPRDTDSIFKLLHNQNTVRDGEFDKESRHILDMKISNYTQWIDDPYTKTLVYEDDGIIRAALFAHFNFYINAWKIELILSDLKNFSGGKITSMLISEMIDYAEAKGFYQYYYIRALDKLMMDKSWGKKDSNQFLWSRYQKGIDEYVKASSRPVTGVYWDWLFNNRCKPNDVVVVHRFLPAEYRKNILE
jgi:ABC-type antimicrobial peptide transport system permease subunit